ncbi:MAG: glycoside hydrolase family 127 protein [Treponema sp.]|jgi:DUF1680 family protein|nr:glycoside hydrolase family 127 protein [Treponema sp.]
MNHFSSFKLSQAQITDPFWGRYLELVRTKVLPYQWEALNDRIPGAEPSYCMYNFKAAAGLIKGGHKGPVFQDSDFGKWVEAVGYVLSGKRDPLLEKTADEAIDIVCAAQRPDGYLNTYYTLTDLNKRWTNLMDHHELYCLGHLLEGAIAYYEATGKNKFLNAMIRYTDLVEKNFGPEPEKLKGYPGHPELELALIKLYRITLNERYLYLAQFFIDRRGQAPLYFEEETRKHGNGNGWSGSHSFHYYQAGMPVRELPDARGHAVRMVYLLCGMAGVAGETGDTSLMDACERLWKNITGRQMYITGAVGSLPHGEAFSFDYDLPNDTIYGETCAAIGLIFFARALLEAAPLEAAPLEAAPLERAPGSCYADVMERALYNAVLSGMSLDGNRFFYVNPLEVWPRACERDFSKNHVKIERQKWFGCACCPPNLARLLASLAHYAFTSSFDGSLLMHLFIGGEFIHKTGGDAVISVKTRYPWEGTVAVAISPEKPVKFRYAFRIPSWCETYGVTLNGEAVSPGVDRGYAFLTREWKKGDVIEITFDMPVRVNEANPAVRENAGKIALSRGPIVYCLEEADNGPNLHLLYLPSGSEFKTEFKENLLGGVETITADALVLRNDWPEDALYRKASPPVYNPKTITWIPYYAWANRGKGEMRVWMNRLLNS